MQRCTQGHTKINAFLFPQNTVKHFVKIYYKKSKFSNNYKNIVSLVCKRLFIPLENKAYIFTPALTPSTHNQKQILQQNRTVLLATVDHVTPTNIIEHAQQGNYAAT